MPMPILVLFIALEAALLMIPGLFRFKNKIAGFSRRK